MIRARLAALVLALVCGLALLQVNPVVRGAESAAERIAVTAGAVYVSLRAINAALSVAQDIEVGGSLGVSANLQPLKVLEPIDDTVERVSGAIFLVAVGAALLSVSFGPMSVFGAGLALAGLLAWQMRLPLARRAVLIGAGLVVVLPVTFWAAAGLAQALTGASLAEAQAQLAAISDHAGGLLGQTEVPEIQSDDATFWDWASGLANDPAAGLGEAVDAAARYYRSAAYFVDNADVILGASLNLIGILLLQTLILPLAILWAVWVVARPLLHRSKFVTIDS